jgi:hypothetical protein
MLWAKTIDECRRFIWKRYWYLVIVERAAEPLEGLSILWTLFLLLLI